MDHESRQSIKCVVWDLDDTLWRGVLLEDPAVALRPEAPDIIETLDRRGILQSIASRNDFDRAMAKLREFGLAEYFLHPQVHWNSKVVSLRAIAEALNIGIDTLALVDDDPHQREEVRFSLPHVLCIDAADLNGLLDRPQMNPRLVTDDARARRLTYIQDQDRKAAESQYQGPSEAFLATLNLSAAIADAGEDDLQRAEELTVRTHQLNTTGRTYSFEELDRLRRSERHKLLIVRLTDRFGDYGRIGLTLIECEPGVWTIRLLLMSCRVMATGIGTIVLHEVMRRAKDAGVTLRADFIPTDVNRMMHVTYRFAGFRQVQRDGDLLTLETDLSHIQPCPGYVRLVTTDDGR